MAFSSNPYALHKCEMCPKYCAGVGKLFFSFHQAQRETLKDLGVEELASLHLPPSGLSLLDFSLTSGKPCN